MNKKIAVVLAVVLLTTVASLAAFWPRGARMLRLPGIVEVQEVRLGSKVGGRIAKILVNEGENVSSGQPLVVFEAPELENQKKQLQARLDSAIAEWQRALNGAREEEKRAARAAAGSAKARYERVKNGPRKEERDQARSDLESAEADHEQTVKDWLRIAELYRQRAVSRSEYDSAMATRDRSKGRLESARARELLSRGSRQEDIDEAEAEYERTRAQQDLLAFTRWEDIAIARAKVDELRANLEAVEINLSEATVVVPLNFGKAVVEVLAIRQGDLVPATQPVVRVLRTEDLWVKIFVPETEYGHVTLNKQVQVTIDSHPDKILHGSVMQRANISEFTPRNVQSVDERRHQVFPVKIRVSDPQGVLNAGMAAEVAIPLE